MSPDVTGGRRPPTVLPLPSPPGRTYRDVPRTVRGELAFEPAPDPGLRNALCRAIVPDVFYPDPSDTAAVGLAKELCGWCPARSACLAAAMSREGSALGRDRYGIRGGATPSERYGIYRRRLRAAAKERQHAATAGLEVA